jgi:hypothetical protein
MEMGVHISRRAQGGGDKVHVITVHLPVQGKHSNPTVRSLPIGIVKRCECAKAEEKTQAVSFHMEIFG